MAIPPKTVGSSLTVSIRVIVTSIQGKNGTKGLTIRCRLQIHGCTHECVSNSRTTREHP